MKSEVLVTFTPSGKAKDSVLEFITKELESMI